MNLNEIDFTNLTDEQAEQLKDYLENSVISREDEQLLTTTLINQAITYARESDFSVGDVSDGIHSFNELYEFRMLYNALAANSNKSISVKSKKHIDGELCFGGGYFIVVMNLPTGQISNHYKLEDWDMFDIPEVDIPPTYDGHTSTDVVNRIRNYINE